MPDAPHISAFRRHADACPACLSGRCLCAVALRLLGQATGMWQPAHQLELFAAPPVYSEPEACRTAQERSVC